MFIIIPTITEKNGQACSWEHNDKNYRLLLSLLSSSVSSIIIIIINVYPPHYYHCLSSSQPSQRRTARRAAGNTMSPVLGADPASAVGHVLCNILEQYSSIFYIILQLLFNILQYFTKSYIITCSFMSYILCADRASAVGYILPPPISSPHIFFNILYYSTR